MGSIELSTFYYRCLLQFQYDFFSRYCFSDLWEEEERTERNQRRSAGKLTEAFSIMSCVMARRTTNFAYSREGPLRAPRIQRRPMIVAAAEFTRCPSQKSALYLRVEGRWVQDVKPEAVSNLPRACALAVGKTVQDTTKVCPVLVGYEIPESIEYLTNNL